MEEPKAILINNRSSTADSMLPYIIDRNVESVTSQECADNDKKRLIEIWIKFKCRCTMDVSVGKHQME